MKNYSYSKLADCFDEMGKKVNLKAKEKKAERKAMEAKMNQGVAAVRAANSVADPLATLPKPFAEYTRGGLDLRLETTRAQDLQDQTKVTS